MEQHSSHILIVNVNSSLNTGDLAFLVCVIHILRGSFDRPEILISANWPDEPALKALLLELAPYPGYIAGVESGKRPLWQVQSYFQGIFWAFRLKCFSTGWFTARIPPGWRSALAIYPLINLIAPVPDNQFFSSGRFRWPLPIIAFPVWLAHLFKILLYVVETLNRNLYGKLSPGNLRSPISFPIP